MFRSDKKKIALMIGLGAALLGLCIAVVYVIDTHFSLNPWGDGDVEMLWYFVVGGIFFPGALRRYREGRQAEPKVPWYRHLDLILCLVGLVSGLAFILSVVQKWVESVLASAIVDQIYLTVLGLALVAVYTSWLALFILFIVQVIKQNKQGKIPLG